MEPAATLCSTYGISWATATRAGRRRRLSAAWAACLVAVSALLPLPLAAQQEPIDPPPSVDKLVKYFETIVFGSEYAGVAPSRAIKKWTGPLRIAVRSFEETKADEGGKEVRALTPIKVKKPFLTFIQKHLNSLAEATGIKTEDAKITGEPPNFMINFLPRNYMADPRLVDADPALLKRMAAEGGCYFVIWADDRTGSIQRAVIVVNAERLLIRINHCLLEEMTQSLGLPNDSNDISPSIFHDDSRRTDLTRTDLIILKALYDPRLAPGMPKAEAMAKVRDVIAELNDKLPAK
ncbi:MAG: DUF2927 domain-containing protein [Rhodospirillales bacterium]|nr:DUF2927 domain-containing protein [Rhodospirillales bacterium]